jgi:curved DNA-binding protein CbpA
MNGQLSDYPLGEMIREITGAALSGALRLERERVKLVIYFDEGQLHYAASNLRAHRLTEVLKRNNVINDGQLAQLSAVTSDDELAATLLRRGAISRETLDKVRTSQVADVLRLALLWTDGAWDFDSRVRLADDIRAVPKLDQLLMEGARHLPPGFVVSRFNGANDTLSRPAHEVNGVDLLPVEAFVLSRVEAPMTLAELTAISGVPETEALCSVYALALGGLLHRANWPRALSPVGAKPSRAHGKTPRKGKPVPPDNSMADSEGDLEAFFDRMDRARDHFEVLDLGRMASAADVKHAYHTLARRFHPDRFHQSADEVRQRVDAAFARIAQAYETLSNSSLRAAYEAKLRVKGAAPWKGKGPQGTRSTNDPVERVFQQGVAALQQNQPERAVRCLAEAARLAPREARYRAYYGRALAGDAKTRRMAESELLVALSIEPENALHRVMLAELYVKLGLPRRAQGELERALAADPKNQQARELLASLRGKR